MPYQKPSPMTLDELNVTLARNAAKLTEINNKIQVAAHGGTRMLSKSDAAYVARKISKREHLYNLHRAAYQLRKILVAGRAHVLGNFVVDPLVIENHCEGCGEYESECICK